MGKSSPVPFGIKGSGSVEVTDPALILKVQRLRAVKTAEDALKAEREALSADLKQFVVENGHEQFTYGGEPILTATEVESVSLDRDYLAKRAPVALAKATSLGYSIRLSVNPTAKPR